MPEFSDYIVFADESGDHNLVAINPEYPMFVLALCLFVKDDYATSTAPAVLRLKFKHFGHDQIVLHEHDIRKAKGPFEFLTDTARRVEFFDDLNAVMESAPFTLVASAIQKERHRERYDVPDNPYHIALGFALERVYMHLNGIGCRSGITHMLFERRGEKEDAELELAFRRVCDGQNAMRKRLPFEIIMADKRCNSAGLQVADLVARPIGRYLLNPSQPNRAYEILARKFRRSPGGSALGWGLKVFP